MIFSFNTLIRENENCEVVKIILLKGWTLVINTTDGQLIGLRYHRLPLHLSPDTSYASYSNTVLH